MSPLAVAADIRAEPSVVHQLRIYELYKDNTGVFHDRFHKHAMRIMERYDFNIVSTWESEQEDRVEFVYLLTWPNEQTMKAQWEKFMADQEWKDIKKITGSKHGRFVNGIEDRKLILTDFSPRKLLTL
ncbi:NIPSNAP family protein [Microbulbifer taiwanensis]|uniref:NIPSNAP family protein n=1 Tax=Microbulbifer taiwanensis TaxID=986746 RepID=A0ABW1YKC6_9GAMM|nr:NIPSNAP family protein [Microbulbifer taiwanensis]